MQTLSTSYEPRVWLPAPGAHGRLYQCPESRLGFFHALRAAVPAGFRAILLGPSTVATISDLYDFLLRHLARPEIRQHLQPGQRCLAGVRDRCISATDLSR